MPDFAQFLSQQEQIYDRLRDTSKVRNEGTLPAEFITGQPLGGYLIALCHPPEITDQLGEFALRVSHVVPALVYDRVNAHTTLGTSQVRGNFAPDKDQLFALREVVLSVYGTHYDTLRGSALCCDEWAYNQEKVIVLGKPNEPFFHLLQALAQESLRQETALDTSSMSHLSANAFTQQCSPEELKEFFALMRSAPSLGESKPYCLDVGHFIASRSGIHVETYERFRIR